MHYVAAFVSEFCMYANLILFFAVLFPCACVSLCTVTVGIDFFFFEKRIIIFLPSVKLKRIQFKKRCTNGEEKSVQRNLINLIGAPQDIEIEGTSDIRDCIFRG